MSAPEGPLSAIAGPVAEGIARWQQTPEYRRNLLRAGWGAFLLAYAATWWPFIEAGGYIARLDSDHNAWIAVAVWGGGIVLGLLWLSVGFLAARGPRDVMAAVWWTAATVGVAWLLWARMYPADWNPFAVFLLHGLYVGWLALCAMRAWLAMRGMRRAPKAPRPHPSPQGRAGDASAAEAYQAMRGGGGRRVSLDDRNF